MEKVRIINDKYKNHHINVDASLHLLIKNFDRDWRDGIWVVGPNEEAHP